KIDPGRDDTLAHVIGLNRLDGGDLSADHPRHGRDARAHHIAVYQHGAGPALRQATAILGAGHAQRGASPVKPVFRSGSRVVECLCLNGLPAQQRHVTAWRRPEEATVFAAEL
nr:hypothetical protein [Tanacetum cinerariifolium]